MKLFDIGGALCAFMLTAGIAGTARADTVKARCDIYPAGEDKASGSMPCTFSQRQGYVRIHRQDGVEHSLSPVGDDPGNYMDEDGNPAYRQSGLGKAGQIYRLQDESVFVYWEPLPNLHNPLARGVPLP